MVPMSDSRKLIRIDPVFDEPELVRTLFAQHAPYPAIAGYQLDRAHDTHPPSDETGAPIAQPWFRGNWAANGEPLVPGVERILYNERFIAAARAFFGPRGFVPLSLW